MTIEPHRQIIIHQTMGGTGLYRDAWEDTSPEGRRVVIEAVRDWLRAERQRGLAGHWTYQLPRHTAVYKAWKIEQTLAGEPQ